MLPEEVSGRGAIHSFTIIRHVFHAAFKNDLPYILARIELEEEANLFLISNLRDCPIDHVQSGMAVKVVFEAVGEDFLPQFVPIEPVEVKT